MNTDYEWYMNSFQPLYVEVRTLKQTSYNPVLAPRLTYHALASYLLSDLVYHAHNAAR